MARKSAKIDKRGELAANLSSALPSDGESSYELSTAFIPALTRRYIGIWAVVEHLMEGEPWIDRFSAEKLRGAELREPLYRATYDFNEKVCIKRVSVEGRLALAEGEVSYEYKTTVALDWEPGPAGRLCVRPEIGYQFSSLDGQIAAVRELERAGKASIVQSRFEGGDLVLEEGGDYKRLRKVD